MQPATTHIFHTYRPYGADIKETRPYSPCRAACPAHTDVQAYVWLIAQGRYNEAFDVITAVNPIASVCSYICHHPCEQSCRRCTIDEPLAVRHLKRFAIERSRDYRRAKRKLAPKTKGKSVGIIGSGPAGLAAARDLATIGYSVTIYERHPVLGGMLATAIPPYRLPKEALKEDLDDILALGIETKTNCQVGKDLTIDEIKAKHDAVIVAVGLSLSRSLNIPGVEGEDVLLAIPFLQDIAFGKRPKVGNTVLVIGGGNVAMDVARSARRLGVPTVKMVCLESAEEMPAWKWEVEEALEEGITINHRWGPKAVIRRDGKVTGLEVVRVLSVFDKDGRFNPSFDKDTVDFIEADTIIITIGQFSDNSVFNGSSLKTDERGRVIWNQSTHMSSVPGVFMAGEIVTGPGSAIAAVANGHRAALAVHLYLQGEPIEGRLPSVEMEKIPDMPETVKERINRQNRIKIAHLDPETRCKIFEPFEFSYSEEDALKEAGRCRGCGGGAVVDSSKCMACLTCQRVCPYDAPVVQAYSTIRPEYCQACGLCAPECPAQAISMVSYDVRYLRDHMSELVGYVKTGDEPLIVAFLCTHHLGVGGLNLPDNIRVAPVHCLSRIDVLDILKAFECGAEGVALVGCASDTCKYRGVSERLKARVKRAGELLSMLGIDRESLGFLTTSAGNGNPHRKVCLDFAEAIKQKRSRKS